MPTYNPVWRATPAGGFGNPGLGTYPRRKPIRTDPGEAVMTARRADTTLSAPSSRPRPRPTPREPATAGPSIEAPRTAPPAAKRPATKNTRGTSRRRRPKDRGLALPEPVQTGQVVAAAGNAIVTAARVGRLLGRSGWRIAKQLPGVNVVEQQTHRLRETATAEITRLLDAPGARFGSATAEEQRVMMLVHDSDGDTAPLRTAMSELLDRSSEANDAQSREYLFGTIVSQLVPDEARILAALGGGRAFAAVDVVSKQVGRASTRTVLTNASTLGAAAGVSLPHSVGTYLSRLDGYGLLDFGLPDDDLDPQFDTLVDDPAVLAARAGIDAGKQGSAKTVRKSVRLSPLGAEFWAACAPARSALDRRTS